MRVLINTFSILILFFIISCGNDSTGPEEPETTTTTVTGTVQAPDNSTPLAGATVYVGEDAQIGNNKILGKWLSKNNSSSDNCKEPSVDFSAYTCTEADGSFEFEVEIDISETDIELKIFKGSFYFKETVSVDPDEGIADAGETSVPEDVIDMAVVTGSYDRMQDILAKIGFGEVVTDENSSNYGKLELGTEEFDLYDGDGSLDSEYPDMQTLFEDNNESGEPDINNYDIVFINCGATEDHIAAKGSDQYHHSDFVKNTTAKLSTAEISTIENYVENGGKIYATDWAYDYTEQAFPSYIDFLGDDNTPADDTEEQNAAQEGNSGITVDAEILDGQLQDWLAKTECKDGDCLNSDDTIHIEDFLGGWAVIEDLHNESMAKTWIEGPVEWSGGSGVQPLTVTYSVNEGQVIYSSYHTIESEFNPKFRPQERLLQYLVF